MAGKERHYLNEPFILERSYLDQIADLARPLARKELMYLPVRMRTQAARMVVQALAMAHELRRYPEAVRAEREAEETGPPTPGI